MFPSSQAMNLIARFHPLPVIVFDQLRTLDQPPSLIGAPILATDKIALLALLAN